MGYHHAVPVCSIFYIFIANLIEETEGCRTDVRQFLVFIKSGTRAIVLFAIKSKNNSGINMGICGIIVMIVYLSTKDKVKGT